MSDYLQPYGLQHARPPYTSPSPGGCPNSCPLNKWCHPTISSSVSLFSSCPQSFPESGSFPISQLLEYFLYGLLPEKCLPIPDLNYDTISCLWFYLDPRRFCFPCINHFWLWCIGCSNPTRRSNQSILKEINPEYSLEGAEAPIFWPPDAKSQLIGKDPDSGKDWGQEEKGVTEHEMFGWHHWLNEREFEQTLGDSEGQASLVCCSPWDCKKLDMT